MIYNLWVIKIVDVGGFFFEIFSIVNISIVNSEQKWTFFFRVYGKLESHL